MPANIGEKVILAKTKQDLHMLSHPHVFFILLHPWIRVYFSLLIWVFNGSKPVIFFLASLL